MSESDHHTYLLRVWSEPGRNGPPLFRAALIDVATRETHYFSNARALAEHLRSMEPPAAAGHG